MSDYHDEPKLGRDELLAFLRDALGETLAPIGNRIHSIESYLTDARTPKPDPAPAPPVAGGSLPSAGSAPAQPLGTSPVTGGPVVTAADDPLTMLRQQVICKIDAAGQPLSDADIQSYANTCKLAMTALAQGTSRYPAGYTTATVPQLIAYQLEVRDAYTTAIGLLLDAARARDPYAPQLQIA